MIKIGIIAGGGQLPLLVGKNLKLKTTYVERENTNEEVYKKANEAWNKDKKEGETLSYMNTNKLRYKMKNYFTDFEKNLVSYLKTI